MNKAIEIKIPTRSEVESLNIGDLALDCFGQFNRIVSIYARGNDINGRAYICFYTQWGTGANISGSYKEGELIRTLPVCNRFNSAQCDQIEQGQLVTP